MILIYVLAGIGALSIAAVLGLLLAKQDDGYRWL